MNNTNCPAPSCSSWKNTCRNRSRLWPATYLGGNKEDVDMLMRVFDDHLERNSCANDLHADGDRARPIYAHIGKLLPWRGWCTALSRRRFADWHAGGGPRVGARHWTRLGPWQTVLHLNDATCLKVSSVAVQLLDESLPYSSSFQLSQCLSPEGFGFGRSSCTVNLLHASAAR
ncbi:hypothetical protein BD311DRAFT_170672 [Dichomitus squalens]|uniref:Uncharacterized protein n=1 Tax=Dichomitus squalens TaxID=114155 RepID=A0A4Q9M8H8_9APHY|nr:hypothetical protein BD311DRAFT_170672 [Dichomitus squalens]